jgi:ABC-2 type transport system permease protein
LSSEPLGLSPHPGPAPASRRVLAQASAELRTTLGNGEQLLLQLAIPVLVLVFFTWAPVLDLGTGRRVDFLVPGVLALGVMSTAFTGQAIATGFARRYGVLKLLGATPLGRGGLLLGKTLAVLATEAAQLIVLLGVGAALGWRPAGQAAAALLLVLLGTAAFSGLGLLLAGTLRAEATLGAANLLYVVFLAIGGVAFPLRLLPGWLAALAQALPIGALTEGLRQAFQPGASPPWGAALVLGLWAVAALAAAALTFRWE